MIRTKISTTRTSSSLSDFRPVSLCNTVYKVISKVLAHRLKRITKDAVQQNQVGFVSGRVLSDNVLLASELVADFHKPGRISRGCLQVDITKAYDSVEWEFIMNILSAFQLPPLFMDWIWACISTPYYSVSLNGELAGFFPGEKGLRQGDPISSSLFVLAMDVLSKELDLAAREGRFGIHPKCAFPLVTHLSFADDLLIFFDGTADSLRGIMQVLRDFQRKSGLALNLRKTSVFLDGNDRVAAQSVATDFGLTQGSLPVKYLGLPLSSRRLGRIGYQPLLDKVRQRISSWTARHLSFAGRLQLLQSVIYSIINFWAAVFPLPQGCLEELERMCNAFLWSGAPNSAKGAKVSWDSVCTPKESGGLGLKRLVGLNELYGVKLIWKLFEGSDSLWVAWIKSHLMEGKMFWVSDFANKGSWIWRNLMKLRETARPFILCNVLSGEEASFWHDNWTHNGDLLSVTGTLGPQYSGISIDASVHSVVTESGWNVSRSRNPTLTALRAALPAQTPDIDSVEVDYFVWRNSVSAQPSNFSTTTLWKTLHPDPPVVNWVSIVWFKNRIPKHAFIAWLVMRNRMSTRDKLRHWGLHVPAECLLCGAADETTSHLFFECPFSQEVWSGLMAGTGLVLSYKLEDMVVWFQSILGDSKFKTIVKFIFQAVIYFVWKERNGRLHSNGQKQPIFVIKEIRLQIRAKLLGMDREIDSSMRPLYPEAPAIAQQNRVSYLSIWFGRFQV